MANTLINPQMIANEALAEFKNGLGFTKGANTQYDDRFAKKGAKIGNKIDIRLPQRFEVNDGEDITAQIQDVDQEVITLELDQRKNVAFQFSTEELTLSIDKFSETYIRPAAHALANKVDYTGLSLAKEVYNAVGTPGTTPASIDLALDAGQKMTEFSAPKGDRTLILNPKAMNKTVAGMKGLFQSSEQIANQYEKGVMGIAAGFKWRESNNVANMTTGVRGGTPLVAGAAQSGKTLLTDGWTAAALLRVREGEVFTIANVYAVNPITKESTGELQQFVVTEDFSSDVAGAGGLKISPAIITDGPTQTVTAAPADNAALTFIGSASIVSPMNLAFHKDAFVLGTADLEIPKGVDMAAVARDEESGLSIRFVRFYDGKTDKLISRLDILFGWLAARPEWACRIQG